jgi:biopolymer transport protein ExbD
VGEPDLVVRLNCERETLIYLVGSDKVNFADLPARLKRELAARSDWNVYVDASREVNVQDAVDVMNVIRNAQARVVLLPGRPLSDNGQCFLSPNKASKKKKKK